MDTLTTRCNCAGFCYCEPKATGTETLTKAPEVSLAPVVEALHTVYAEHLAPAVLTATGLVLPPAVFVVKRDARAWGHITVRPAWEASTEELDSDYPYAPYAISMGAPMMTTVSRGFHEIMVSGENLARGAREVFGTVAHETAHAFNIASGIRDVDSNGRHNKRFKDSAESLFGLTITEAKGIGWSVTEVGEECATTWAEAIALLEDAITASAPRSGFGVFGGGSRPTTGKGSRGGQGRDKNLKKATCGCGSSIRTSAVALAKGITCGGCGEEFETE
jgi:hypothetical protein